MGTKTTSNLTCSFPVRLRRRLAGDGVRDERGRTSVAHGEPEDIMVFAWYVGGSEPTAEGHQARSIYAATVFPRASDNVGEHDRVELPGYGWFEVDGQPTNYDHNPFWSPGLVDAKLRKVNG